jgi:Lar family restriction alleviation protein
MSKLRPCPFCGSPDVESDSSYIQALGADQIESEWVVCNDCGASGPCRSTDTNAVASWNWREGTTEDFMRERIELSKQGPTGEAWKPFMKLSEEVGELSEALLIEMGSLAYKEKEVSAIDEIADVLNAVAAILARHYSDMSTNEILEMLNAASRRKILKYKVTVLGHEKSD